MSPDFKHDRTSFDLLTRSLDGFCNPLILLKVQCRSSDTTHRNSNLFHWTQQKCVQKCDVHWHPKLASCSLPEHRHKSRGLLLFQWVTGVCPVILQACSWAKGADIVFFSIGSQENELLCPLTSISNIAFLLNPSGSQFAFIEVWRSVMMAYWPIWYLVVRTEGGWEDSSCLPMWYSCVSVI